MSTACRQLPSQQVSQKIQKENLKSVWEFFKPISNPLAILSLTIATLIGIQRLRKRQSRLKAEWWSPGPSYLLMDSWKAHERVWKAFQKWRHPTNVKNCALFTKTARRVICLQTNLFHFLREYLEKENDFLEVVRGENYLPSSWDVWCVLGKPTRYCLLSNLLPHAYFQTNLLVP